MRLHLTILSAALVASFAPAQDLVRTIGGTNYTLKDYSYNNARGANHSFLARLYVPTDYDPSKTYPLVMFLHGDGEAGTNNSDQINNNINNLIVNAENRDFLLYAPQSPGTYWGDELLTITQANFARAMQEYRVDPSRIYATGLSKGGQGVQKLMNDFNQTYAAYVPLSVATSSTLDASKAAGLPAWYWHGRADTIISVATGRSAVTKLINAQGGPTPPYPSLTDPNDFYHAYGTIRYTELANGGHNNVVWSNGAYNSAAVYDWMLSYDKDVTQLDTDTSIGINFNSGGFAVSTDSAGQVWNTLGRYGAERTETFALGFARTADNDTTLVSMKVTKAFDNSAISVPVGVTAFADASVAGKYWRTLNNQSAELKFYGLEPGDAYRFDIFASTTDANVIGLYSAAGVSASLMATGNLDQFAVLDNVIADINGTITLTVTPTNGASRAVINAVTLSAVPEPTAATLLIPMTAAIVRRRR